MAASTPAEWLPILAKRLDDRFERVAKCRRYARGQADLPEMGRNLRASWEKFQKKARRDFGGLAIGSLSDRCVPNGIRVGTTETSEAVVAARRIWRDNRMDVQFAEAKRDYLETSFGYMVVGVDASGAAVITREAPEQFIAATDPIRPWRARAALKVWRDVDAGFDFARVWVPGRAQVFTRPTVDGSGVLRAGAAGGDWKPDGDPEDYDGDPPVVVWERGEGFLEPHHDHIDGINLGKLNRLVITAMQAFRQRALKKDGDAGTLPDADAAGNPIDWKKVFEPAPGALWDLPAGIDIWESQQTDIRPLLEGEKADARDFAAVTRTPISVFIPEGENQSAEGAASAKEGQIAQARAEIKRLDPGLAVLVVYALRAEGVDLGGDTVQMLWTPPEHVSLSEKFAAAAQAKAAGLSRRAILRDILGMTPDQIAQDELDLAAEQLSAAALIGAGGGEGGGAVA